MARERPPGHRSGSKGKTRSGDWVPEAQMSAIARDSEAATLSTREGQRSRQAMLGSTVSLRARRASLSPAELGSTRVRPLNDVAEVGNIPTSAGERVGGEGEQTSRLHPPHPPLPCGEREQAVPVARPCIST